MLVTDGGLINTARCNNIYNNDNNRPFKTRAMAAAPRCTWEAGHCSGIIIVFTGIYVTFSQTDILRTHTVSIRPSRKTIVFQKWRYRRRGGRISWSGRPANASCYYYYYIIAHRVVVVLSAVWNVYSRLNNKKLLVLLLLLLLSSIVGTRNPYPYIVSVLRPGRLCRNKIIFIISLLRTRGPSAETVQVDPVSRPSCSKRL